MNKVTITLRDSGDDLVPRRSELVAIATIAILLRAALFLIVSLRFHYSFHDWAWRDDGASYQAFARALLGDPSHMTAYHQRVFPGYPALIALLHLLHIPFEAAAVGLDWACAGLVAAMGAILFRDRRIGYALVCLPLQYFINSSLPMSETPLLALTLAGLLLATRGRSKAGGVFLGLAGLVRPMACFAVIGQFCREVWQRRYRTAFVTAAIAGLIVALGIGALQHWSGDALRGVKVYANNPAAYNGHLIEWPFQSLIHESLRPQVPRARVLYIWLHVIVTLTALAIVSLRCWCGGRAADSRDTLAAPWLAGNTLFVLCVGSYWGFEHFPRFTIPALPALFWGVRAVLPRRRIFWVAIASVVLVSAVFVVLGQYVVPDEVGMEGVTHAAGK